MDLILHPTADQHLADRYAHAFRDAVELYVVSAYLTDWDSTLRLSPECRRFRLIVGKDFGITRKEACRRVLTWLPPERKDCFLVADRIQGFHPKAIFWKDRRGRCYCVIGSSNLSHAAFCTNTEANISTEISADVFSRAKAWLAVIEEKCVPVSEDWLANYREAEVHRGRAVEPVISFRLPKPPGTAKALEKRRLQLSAHRRRRAGLEDLLRQCANRRVTNHQFLEQLPRHWSWDAGNRLQGRGWERRGNAADFQALASAYVSVLDAAADARDDTVRRELDVLAAAQNPARQAFLSELLCLTFPKDYPLLNAPIRQYLRDVEFRPARGGTEGSRYIDLARKLRAALQQNPTHPARNLAELDAVIWLAARREFA